MGDATKHGLRPNVCHWPPKQARPTEVEIYEGIRSTMINAHCAAGRDEHHCCGRVTIDRTSLTLQCPLCGDLKVRTSDDG
jgi:hypothetical protein